MNRFILAAPDSRFPKDRCWYLELNIQNIETVQNLRYSGHWNGDETMLASRGVKRVLINRIGGYFIPNVDTIESKVLEKEKLIFPPTCR